MEIEEEYQIMSDTTFGSNLYIKNDTLIKVDFSAKRLTTQGILQAIIIQIKIVEHKQRHRLMISSSVRLFA